MLAAASLARGLRRRRASPASDSNARAVHADTLPPGSRKPSDRPPERPALAPFGWPSPSLTSSSRFMPPDKGKKLSSQCIPHGPQKCTAEKESGGHRLYFDSPNTNVS